MIAIITLSIITYVWFVREDLQVGNQESPKHMPDTGSLEGAITDHQGIPLAGINVAIINGTTAYPETTVETNVEGHYLIEGVPPGKFEVALFDRQKTRIKVENVTVISGETSLLDFKITSDSTCPATYSSYKWTPIGTFSENFNWKCLRCGYGWTEALSEDRYESWRNKFLEPDFVRDYTLLYLRTILEIDVPDPLTLEWVGGRETPEQILGYETFIYKADGITVTIGYPVVLPPIPNWKTHSMTIIAE
jgi:hypothetical protein